MKFIIILIAMVSMNSYAGDCDVEAVAAAVKAAKNKINPRNEASKPNVSDDGEILVDTKDKYDYFSYYVIGVSDEVDGTYWSVITHKEENCAIINTSFLMYDE